MIGTIGPDAEHNLARLRTRDADVDVVEHRTLTVALVLDNDTAVFQADLVEVVAVEAERAHAVDPGE